MAHVNIIEVLSRMLDDFKQDMTPSWDDAHTLAQIATATTWDSAQEQNRAADLVMLVIAYHGSPKHKKEFPNLDSEDTLNELCALLRDILRGTVSHPETATPNTSK